MTLFTDKAPGIMRLLMADFGLSDEEAAAIVGNLGHESGGFKFLQELKPMVPGSKGGWGWAQWTGPRRRSFEAYCARNNLDPASDKANYGWLFVELTTTEKKAIPAVKNAADLQSKVIAFEKAFERAGIKHYDSRLKYAKQALNAYRRSLVSSDDPGPAPEKPVQPVPAPPDIPTPATPKKPASGAPKRFTWGGFAMALIFLVVVALILARSFL